MLRAHHGGGPNGDILGASLQQDLGDETLVLVLPRHRRLIRLHLAQHIPCRHFIAFLDLPQSALAWLEASLLPTATAAQHVAATLRARSVAGWRAQARIKQPARMTL